MSSDARLEAIERVLWEVAHTLGDATTALEGIGLELEAIRKVLTKERSEAEPDVPGWVNGEEEYGRERDEGAGPAG